MIEPPVCERCGSDNVKLRRYIISNGDAQFRWQCQDCKRCARKSSQNISHTAVQELVEHYGRTVTDIEDAANYSKDITCDVCGAIGAEVHHWAPQALKHKFGDEWHRWPKAHLCRYHHRQWHTIVTPYFNGGYQNATVAEAAHQND